MAINNSYFTFDVQEDTENQEREDGTNCGPDADFLAQGKRLQDQTNGAFNSGWSNHFADSNFKRMRRNTCFQPDNALNL